MAVQTKKFRLTIWKPTRQTRDLLILSSAAPKSARERSDFEFHEAIYSWEPREDVWLSVIDSRKQRELSSLLFERFSPERTVDERGIEHLEEAIDAIERLLSDPSQTAWMDCEELLEIPNAESINLRCHGIAALHNHLRWVYEVFKDSPGVSVTIR